MIVIAIIKIILYIFIYSAFQILTVSSEWQFHAIRIYETKLNYGQYFQILTPNDISDTYIYIMRSYSDKMAICVESGVYKMLQFTCVLPFLAL